MARTFSAAEIRLLIGGANITGESFAAVLARPTSAAAMTLFSLWDATTERLTFCLNSSKQPRLVIAGTGASGGEIGVTPGTNEWNLYGYDKAAGSVPPRWHHYGLTEQVFHHANDTTNLGNPTTQAGGTMRIGTGVEGAMVGDIAAAAVWPTRPANPDLAFELLAFRLQSWVDLNPGAGVILDQAAVAQKVNDFTGKGANETAITGTSVASTSVPISYGGA
ncbi:MAG TPA: hypothetical protein VI039_12910 [Solirubrobacterales bacterium]